MQNHKKKINLLIKTNPNSKQDKDSLKMYTSGNIYVALSKKDKVTFIKKE